MSFVREGVNHTTDLNSLIDNHNNELNSKLLGYNLHNKKENLPRASRRRTRVIDPNINLGKALLCSACFLGMYSALYTAQNI
jgi:hypothetical protein